MNLPELIEVSEINFYSVCLINSRMKKLTQKFCFGFFLIIFKRNHILKYNPVTCFIIMVHSLCCKKSFQIQLSLIFRLVILVTPWQIFCINYALSSFLPNLEKCVNYARKYSILKTKCFQTYN